MNNHQRDNSPPRILIDIPSSGADGRDRLTGIFRYLSEGHFWNLTLPSTHAELTAEFVRNVLTEGIDGAIIAARYEEDIARLLTRSRIPVILMHDSWMHRPFVGKRFHFSLSDHVAIGRLAARHFLSLGHFSEHAFVGDTERNRWGIARHTGFARELRRHAITSAAFIPPRSVFRVIDRDQFRKWLEKRKTPLAIFAASDRMAVQVIGCCRTLGLSVPKDVAVLGVDNDETLISACSPRLSSILPDFQGAGYTAAKQMDNLIAGRKVSRTRLFAPLMLVERASTAPLSPAVRLTEEALAYIDRHATDGLTPAILATHLRVSRPLLDLRFRELKLGTVADAIRKRQLGEVGRLLRETDYTIRQIGARCGFQNERSLKNIFLREFKMTMTSYRNRSK